MTVGVDVLAQHEAVSFEQINEVTDPFARIDRKYIVTSETLEELVDSLRPGALVLEIEGRRAFSYESIYFDTPGLALYREAAFGRRRRFKVRSRLYRDSQEVMLEVKSRSGRGHTIKGRYPYSIDDRDRLTRAGRAFVEGIVGSGELLEALKPTMTTSYQRTTVADLVAGARMTIDSGVQCRGWSGGIAKIADIVLETKSSGAASPFDRWLWGHGIRPIKLSKYCTAMAVINPDLPSNKWHRTKRCFDVDSQGKS